MSQILTPKQVARAVGISESSLKRWCDRGRLPAVRTAGGHRRLKKTDILRLVRQGELSLENPAALGLHASAGRGTWTLDQARECVIESLVEGNFEATRLAAVDLFLDGHSMAAICDSVLGAALRTVGTLWENEKLEVYTERRATMAIMRVLYHFRDLLPDPLPNATVAIGGCPPGDFYSAPTLMVELLLTEGGWRATSLGGPLPLDNMLSAIERHRPRLFWMSVSFVADEAQFLRDYLSFYERVPSSTAVVLGGRALTEPLRKQMRYATYCDDMRDLEQFVRAVAPPAVHPPEASEN